MRPWRNSNANRADATTPPPIPRAAGFIPVVRRLSPFNSPRRPCEFPPQAGGRQAFGGLRERAWRRNDYFLAIKSPPDPDENREGGILWSLCADMM